MLWLPQTTCDNVAFQEHYEQSEGNDSIHRQSSGKFGSIKTDDGLEGDLPDADKLGAGMGGESESPLVKNASLVGINESSYVESSVDIGEVQIKKADEKIEHLD